MAASFGVNAYRRKGSDKTVYLSTETLFNPHFQKLLHSGEVVEDTSVPKVELTGAGANAMLGSWFDANRRGDSMEQVEQLLDTGDELVRGATGADSRTGKYYRLDTITPGSPETTAAGNGVTSSADAGKRSIQRTRDIDVSRRSRRGVVGQLGDSSVSTKTLLGE